MTSGQQLVCFGEILWDLLPSGKLAGGAPMNVAFRAATLGLPARLISRVGEDGLGRELLDFLAQKELVTDLVQLDAGHPTGVVNVQLTAAGQPSYEIVQPVAWDFIELTPAVQETVAASRLFVFGSLAARSAVTRATLLQLLDVAPFRVFDINLRAPFYSRELLETFLSRAHLIKMNDEELDVLSDWYALSGTQEERMRQLRHQFGWQGAITTLGADGAMYLDGDTCYRQGGFPVQVQDTIGSGDAFLAAFLCRLAQQDPPERCLQYAAAAGALVATQKGATQLITPEQIDHFLKDKTH